MLDLIVGASVFTKASLYRDHLPGYGKWMNPPHQCAREAARSTLDSMERTTVAILAGFNLAMLLARRSSLDTQAARRDLESKWSTGSAHRSMK
jgi:hypothetical protein